MPFCPNVWQQNCDYDSAITVFLPFTFKSRVLIGITSLNMTVGRYCFCKIHNYKTLLPNTQ